MRWCSSLEDFERLMDKHKDSASVPDLSGAAVQLGWLFRREGTAQADRQGGRPAAGGLVDARREHYAEAFRRLVRLIQQRGLLHTMNIKQVADWLRGASALPFGEAEYGRLVWFIVKHAGDSAALYNTRSDAVRLAGVAGTLARTRLLHLPLLRTASAAMLQTRGVYPPEASRFAWSMAQLAVPEQQEVLGRMASRLVEWQTAAEASHLSVAAWALAAYNHPDTAAIETLLHLYASRVVCSGGDEARANDVRHAYEAHLHLVAVGALDGAGRTALQQHARLFASLRAAYIEKQVSLRGTRTFVNRVAALLRDSLGLQPTVGDFGAPGGGGGDGGDSVEFELTVRYRGVDVAIETQTAFAVAANEPSHLLGEKSLRRRLLAALRPRVPLVVVRFAELEAAADPKAYLRRLLDDAVDYGGVQQQQPRQQAQQLLQTAIERQRPRPSAASSDASAAGGQAATTSAGPGAGGDYYSRPRAVLGAATASRGSADVESDAQPSHSGLVWSGQVW